jgi:hypothetical protein
MTKKKVSKKKASSSVHATKKHVTHTKPAIERLDVAPVVQTEVAPNVNSVVKQPVEKIEVIPAQEFVEDKAEKQNEPETEHKVSVIIKIFAIAMCCVVVLFWIGLAALSIEYNSGPKIIVKNVSVTTYGYVPISLSKFMNITDVKYSERVIQKGYLRQELTDKGIIKKYIVDDKNNKIELMLRGISQSEQYDKLFSTGETTKAVYNVSGIFRFEINRYIIDVDNITPEARIMNESSVWRMENITTDDVRGVTFNIARGVNKVVKFVYV